MNYGISVLFRAIPLLMALFCFGYGWFITSYGTDPNRYVAGPVIFSLGMICIALFSTAATIIRQIIGTFGQVSKYTLPGIGYLSAVLTIIGGMHILHSSPDSASFVAGHVICGVGFITACVATTATSSTRFTMITRKNAQKSDHDVPPKAFTRTQGLMLISVACHSRADNLDMGVVLLSKSSLHPKYFVAGHVMIGLASICTCLITLVATIARQIRNIFSQTERKIWPVLVLVVGSLCIIWGLILILGTANMSLGSTGYIMIGLGLVCYSISSKVILLSKIWRHEFKLPPVPLIPIFTALTCLFLSAFLFEIDSVHGYYFVPARVLAGLEASVSRFSPS